VEQQYNEAPWTIQQTFTGILFTLVPWIALALGLSLISPKPTRTSTLSPQVDLTNAIIVFIFSALIEGAFLIAPFYFASRAFRSTVHRTRSTFETLGFRSFNVGSALFWIVLLFFAVLITNALYQAIINTLHLPLQTNDQVILEQAKNAPLTTYATLIAGVVVAPFCEEIFFRGFVFPGLLRGMSLGWAIVLSSLIFAVAHADPGSFAVLFVIGLALAFLRWHTRSIWPGMLLHLLNNGIGVLLIVLSMQGIIR